MVDNPLKNQGQIIDLEEKVLTKEEIETLYVDIKQAAQIMNNVSDRTAYRYLDKVSASKGFEPKSIEVSSSGGVKKLYLKEDIVTIAKILNKDKTVLVHVPVNVSDNNVNDNNISETLSDNMSVIDKELSKTGRELSLSNRELFNKVISAIDTINSSQAKIGELCEVLGRFEKKADTIVDKLMQQGMDFQQNFFNSKKEELKIEMDKVALEKNKIEAEKKNQESLQELTKAMLQKKNSFGPVWLIVLSSMVLSGAVILSAFFYVKNAETKWNQKINESRMAEEERTDKIIASLTAIQEELKEKTDSQNSKDNTQSDDLINKE